MRNFAPDFITETNNLKHYNLMKTTLLSLKAFFTICLLCLVGGMNVMADTYTYTFKKGDLEFNFPLTKSFNEVTWTINGTTTAYNVDKTNLTKNLGLQLGKSKNEINLNFSTDQIKGTITSVKVEAAVSGTTNPGNIIVKVGGKNYGSAEIKSNPATAYEFTGNLSGKIDINFDNGTAKKSAVYVKSITITYSAAKTGTFTLTTAQYGTYYTEDAYVMPEGVTGYTITSEDGKTLKFNEAYVADAVVPAKTALVLKATEELTANKEYTYTIVNSDAAAPANNLLHGSVAEAMTSVKDATAYYKLAQGEDGLGFYYGAENGGEFKNGAHKAYLAVMTENLSQKRGFSFDSMTTGINHVVANAEHAKTTVIYDLNGRRVNSLNAAAKGVYIVNGKKVIVK